MINLYLIDHHYFSLKGIVSSFIENSDYVSIVGTSFTINESISMITTITVDIILLDFNALDDNPIINFHKLANQFPTIPIIIMAQEASIFWQIELFSLGAMGFILKSEDIDLISKKIEIVYSGGTVFPRDVHTAKMIEEKAIQNSMLPTEYKTIIFLLSKGHSIKQISKILSLSDSAVEKKIKRIRSFFQVSSNCELVCTTLSMKSFCFKER
jgi:DNA-binding NarL/FixJ family response regulator